VPRSEIDLPAEAQIGPYTSRAAVIIGKALANVPGLPDATKSPRRIDAAIRGFFGGAVPDALDALKLGAYRQGEREFEASDIPVMGKLFRRGGAYNAQSQNMADFWELNNKLQARAQAVTMQMTDPTRPQTIPLDDMSLVLAPLFEDEAKSITFSLRLANQMKESAVRREIYKQAAVEAKLLTDYYNQTINALGVKP
jgi:hypothetical protein